MFCCLILAGASAQSTSGSVTATQSPIPGTTASVNTINSSVQTSGPYTGSASSLTAPFPDTCPIRMPFAAVRYNLGPVGLSNSVIQAHGQLRVACSALLRNLNSTLSETVQQTNLQAMGIRVSLPNKGFAFPTIVGPFNYFDLRARLTQSGADLSAINKYRSSRETLGATQSNLQDSRDLVVLAVEVAKRNLEVTRQTFDLTRQRFDSGISEYVAVVQAQESFASADLDLINRVFAHNVAKLSLARATGTQ